MNLKQTIRRILREELYSPAGEEITPNKIVVHKSNPMFRDRILEEGLKVRVGDCYQIYVNREQRDPDEIKCKPVIFATNSKRKKDWFDSTYDDDIWVINTECAGVNWFKDKHYDNDYHIVTLEDISPDCLKLIHKGTGESEDLIQESKKDKKITCDNCGWSWKLSEGGDDPYTCHKCWNENQLQEVELTEKCWPGYTQKGMKTMFGKRYPNCVKKKKTLKEWYATRNREKEMGMSYVKFEGIINNLMGRKYDWWKGIHIDEVLYSQMNDVISIYGYLDVDKKWAIQQLNKYRPYFNSEDGEGVEMEDIVSSEFRKELSDYLTMLFSTTTNHTNTVGVRLNAINIRFV